MEYSVTKKELKNDPEEWRAWDGSSPMQVAEEFAALQFEGEGEPDDGAKMDVVVKNPETGRIQAFRVTVKLEYSYQAVETK